MFQLVTLSLYIAFLTLLTYLILLGIETDLRPHFRKISVERIYKHRPELVGSNTTRFGPVDLTVHEGPVSAIDQTLLAFVLVFALVHLFKKVPQCFREVNAL